MCKIQVLAYPKLLALLCKKFEDVLIIQEELHNAGGAPTNKEADFLVELR